MTTDMKDTIREITKLEETLKRATFSTEYDSVLNAKYKEFVLPTLDKSLFETVEQKRADIQEYLRSQYYRARCLAKPMADKMGVYTTADYVGTKMVTTKSVFLTSCLMYNDEIEAPGTHCDRFVVLPTTTNVTLAEPLCFGCHLPLSCSLKYPKCLRDNLLHGKYQLYANNTVYEIVFPALQSISRKILKVTKVSKNDKRTISPTATNCLACLGCQTCFAPIIFDCLLVIWIKLKQLSVESLEKGCKNYWRETTPIRRTLPRYIELDGLWIDITHMQAFVIVWEQWVDMWKYLKRVSPELEESYKLFFVVSKRVKAPAKETKSDSEVTTKSKPEC